MKFVILGSGAMGCLWGAQISLGGHQVHLLHHRQDFVDTVNRLGGIRMLHGAADEAGDVPETLAPARASIDFESPFREGPVDCVIVLLKTHQTAKAMARMRPILEKYAAHETVVCTLQNGIGNVETIMGSGGLRADRVLYGTTTTFSTMRQDAVIEQFEHKRPTNIWTADQSAQQLSEKQQAVVDCMRACGFQVNATPDARKLLWSKLAVNCSINTVTAICRLKIGKSWSFENDLEKATPGRELMLRIAAEVATVARAEGINLSDDEAQQAVSTVAIAAAEHTASMCRDMISKRPTEIDALNGQVMQYARKHSIQVPATEHMYMLVKLMERTYDERIDEVSR